MLEAHLKAKSLNELNARLPDEVEQVTEELTSLLQTEPANTGALFLLARCQLQRDELSEAKQTLETLVNEDPGHTAAKTQLAGIHFKNDDRREAIRLLADVTSTSPEIAAPWGFLSECLKKDGQQGASEDALKQFNMIKAFNAKLRFAQEALAKEDFKTADTICKQLLQLVPNEVRTLRILASIAMRFQHYEYATSTLAQCVEARPGDAPLGLEYGYTLLSSKRYEDSLAQCEHLIEIAPEMIDVYDLKAEALFNLGRYSEAIDVYRELIKVPEKRALRMLHLGKVLKTVGDVEEATSVYQQAIKIEPDLGQAYWELADLKTYRFSDDEIEGMRAQLESGGLSAMDKVLVQFALGKALEDAGQFEKSFQNYQAANSAYMNSRKSDYSSQNERFVSTFTEEYFAARKDHGDDTDAPIFVLGLPRSGSTLLEQILSSHSQVDATQELEEIVSIARDVNDPSQQEQGQYPQVVTSLGADQARELAQRYLDYAGPFRQQAPHFVDKAPHNFHHIGLIKTLFPNARIIDIRRNPMASGWSLYRQFFADSFMFSYDLETIGRFHNDYVALMNHWHTVLPGQILTVSYEDLVENFSATVNSILTYCGLEFEEACLSFHLNERAVATPSSEQVRQPLYSDALEHWKNYEQFLEPLKQIIENDEAS